MDLLAEIHMFLRDFWIAEEDSSFLVIGNVLQN